MSRVPSSTTPQAIPGSETGSSQASGDRAIIAHVLALNGLEASQSELHYIYIYINIYIYIYIELQVASSGNSSCPNCLLLNPARRPFVLDSSPKAPSPKLSFQAKALLKQNCVGVNSSQLQG